MSPQDTPGRPKSSASRQQTQPNQGTQSGTPEIDAKDTGPEEAKLEDRNQSAAGQREKVAPTSKPERK